MYQTILIIKIKYTTFQILSLFLIKKFLTNSKLNVWLLKLRDRLPKKISLCFWFCETFNLLLFALFFRNRSTFLGYMTLELYNTLLHQREVWLKFDVHYHQYMIFSQINSTIISRIMPNSHLLLVFEKNCCKFAKKSAWNVTISDDSATYLLNKNDLTRVCCWLQ